jgi:hypothetical protein
MSCIKRNQHGWAASSSRSIWLSRGLSSGGIEIWFCKCASDSPWSLDSFGSLLKEVADWPTRVNNWWMQGARTWWKSRHLGSPLLLSSPSSLCNSPNITSHTQADLSFYASFLCRDLGVLADLCWPIKSPVLQLCFGTYRYAPPLYSVSTHRRTKREHLPL